MIVCYARVSTREQGLETQMMHMRNYCEARGEQYKMFTDVASAVDYGRRKEWRKLINDITLLRIKPSAVLVAKVDRIARNGKMFYDVWRMLDDRGIELITLDKIGELIHSLPPSFRPVVVTIVGMIGGSE